jgi:hypothetical protein
MRWGYAKKKTKTYNSGDSLVVTHLTTNPPVHCLYMAERTGSLIFSVLWSYVKEIVVVGINKGGKVNDDSISKEVEICYRSPLYRVLSRSCGSWALGV